MITSIIEAFSYPFFQRAFFVGCILAVTCSLLGNFVVLRKEALITHTISHLTLCGIALGLLFGLNVNVAMYVAAIVGAIIIFKLQSSQRFSADSILAFTAQISIAVAIIVMSLLSGYRNDLIQYLFGDMLALSTQDIYAAIIIGTTVSIVLFFLKKPLMKVIFNEEIALSSRQKVQHIHLIFVLLLAITIAIGIKIVGVLLVAALLVIPSNIGKLYAHNFQQMQYFSLVAALCGCILGLFFAYLFDVPSGATIIATLGIILAASHVFQRHA